MKRKTPYVDENGLPVWARRVSKRSIAELYHTEAHGIRDADLIDDVGIALLSRCESILTVAAALCGQYECPACLATWEQASNNPEVLKCPACGWAIPWEQFRGTCQHEQLGAENAVAKAFFEEFVMKFPRASQPGHKMILIDMLLHRFHSDEKDGPPTRPAAINLIQGIVDGPKVEDVIAFLNHLTYDENSMPETRQTLSNWYDKNPTIRPSVSAIYVSITVMPWQYCTIASSIPNQWGKERRISSQAVASAASNGRIKTEWFVASFQSSS